MIYVGEVGEKCKLMFSKLLYVFSDTIGEKQSMLAK